MEKMYEKYCKHHQLSLKWSGNLWQSPAGEQWHHWKSWGQMSLETEFIVYIQHKPLQMSMSDISCFLCVSLWPLTSVVFLHKSISRLNPFLPIINNDKPLSPKCKVIRPPPAAVSTVNNRCNVSTARSKDKNTNKKNSWTSKWVSETSAEWENKEGEMKGVVEEREKTEW